MSDFAAFCRALERMQWMACLADSGNIVEFAKQATNADTLVLMTTIVQNAEAKKP